MDGRSLTDLVRKAPLLWAVVIVVVPSTLGFIIAQQDIDKELRKILYAASTTLIFGGFIGGLLKILLEDFALSRQRCEDSARFITNVFTDLKSVYDRVGRVRILIPAHKSAKTYGDEMRDLIEARVTLLNVRRAFYRQKEGLDPTTQKNIDDCVQLMEEYLGTLTEEFKDEYKPLSDAQRLHEARVKGLEEKLKEDPEHKVDYDLVFKKENVWDRLQKLPELDGLINDKPESPYETQFEIPLRKASELLRKELTRVLGGKISVELDDANAKNDSN